MSLKETLRTDLTCAMKAKLPTEVATLRMVLAAVMNSEVAGTTAVELTDDQILDVLTKESKKRAEAAEAFGAAGRVEQAQKERDEAEIIARYLPKAMDDAELTALVGEQVKALGATSAKEMGAVVKAVREIAGPRCDGGRIAAAVKSALA